MIPTNDQAPTRTPESLCRISQVDPERLAQSHRRANRCPRPHEVLAVGWQEEESAAALLEYHNIALVDCRVEMVSA